MRGYHPARLIPLFILYTFPHIPLSTFYHRRYNTIVSSAIFHHQRFITLRRYGQSDAATQQHGGHSLQGTKPERIVRQYLWRRGFRYRLNSPRLPGHPDLVLRKYRTCIFVNGCFWHGHADCGGFRLPKTNVAFWQRKIERNKERDCEEQRKLAQMGWHCITVWECELKNARRQQTLEALAHTLNHIFLQDHSRPKGPTHYRLREEEEMTGMAAEPEQRGSEQPNNGGNK